MNRTEQSKKEPARKIKELKKQTKSTFYIEKTVIFFDVSQHKLLKILFIFGVGRNCVFLEASSAKDNICSPGIGRYRQNLTGIRRA